MCQLHVIEHVLCVLFVLCIQYCPQFFAWEILLAFCQRNASTTVTLFNKVFIWSHDFTWSHSFTWSPNSANIETLKKFATFVRNWNTCFSSLVCLSMYSDLAQTVSSEPQTFHNQTWYGSALTWVEASSQTFGMLPSGFRSQWCLVSSGEDFSRSFKLLKLFFFFFFSFQANFVCWSTSWTSVGWTVLNAMFKSGLH